MSRVQEIPCIVGFRQKGNHPAIISDIFRITSPFAATNVIAIKIEGYVGLPVDWVDKKRGVNSEL